MAPGKMEVTTPEEELRISAGPDRVIGACLGTFPNGTEYKIEDGRLTVKQAGADVFITATSEEVDKVKRALEAKFGEPGKAPRVQLNDRGLFVLLDTAPSTPFQASVREGWKTIAQVTTRVANAATNAARGVREAVGITGSTVRRNGMVSLARTRLENGEALDDIAETLAAMFTGAPDLDNLIQVAIREAQDQEKNKAEDFGTVSEFKLDAEVATRLENREDPDSIEHDLGKRIKSVHGRKTERSPGEVKSIVTIAFERGEVLRKLRADKALSEQEKKNRRALKETQALVRENGMVSLIRDGLTDEDLKRLYGGTSNLAHLIEVATTEARNEGGNKKAAQKVIDEKGLVTRVIQGLDKGDAPDDIRNNIEPDLRSVTGGTHGYARGDAEIKQILDMAFKQAEAERTSAALIAGQKKRINDYVDARVNGAWESLGITQRMVHGNGMVARARDLLETRTPEDVKAAFKTEDRFKNLPDLENLTRVAINIASDPKANQAEYVALVKKDNLANIVADRLSEGRNANDIRTDLLSSYRHFTRADGVQVKRGDKERGDIVNMAMAAGQKAYEGRKKESEGSLRVAVRENGMVSYLRTFVERGTSDENTIRDVLSIHFEGIKNLSRLIDAALDVYKDTDRNRQWASVIENRQGLGRDIAGRLSRGEPRASIESGIVNSLKNYIVDGRSIIRSDAEIHEILTVAFEEAQKVEAKREKMTEAALVERANTLGMVVVASYLIHEDKKTPAEAEDRLVEIFGVDRVRELAVIAVQEAQDVVKVRRTLASTLEGKGEASSILNERAAGVSDTDIETRLRVDYAQCKVPGYEFPRSTRDLDLLVQIAFEQAGALERKRAAEVVEARRSNHLKNTVKAWVPGTEQAAWDEKLVKMGLIREIRKKMENSGYDESVLRAELERRLTGESDPAGMAHYAIERATDSTFNKKQAEKVAFMKSFDRSATTRLAVVGATPATVELDLITEIEAELPGVSKVEATEIAQAAIQRAQNKKNWETRGTEAKTWARGPGWEGLKKVGKYGAMGAGLLGLGTAAVATVGTILTGVMGWKALKFGWNTGKDIVKTATPYALPMGAAAVKTTLDATVGVAKFARNTLLYAPASGIYNIAKRAYQGARAGLNLPTPPRIEEPLIKEKKGLSYPFTAIGNLFRRTTTGIGNIARSLFHRSQQALLLPATLAAGLLVGGGEGLGIAGHHILGYDWNGSHDLDHLAEETSKAPTAPAPHGHPAPAAHAAPKAAAHGAAHGDDHAKPAHH